MASPTGNQTASSISAVSPASTNDTELEFLRNKVAELEARLQQVHTGRSESPADQDPSGHRDNAARDPGSTGAPGEHSRAFDLHPIRPSAAHVAAADSYPTPDNESADPVVQNAASILEFLSWGRKKNPDLHDVSLEASEAMANPGDVRDVDSGPVFATCLDDSQQQQLNFIQMLLPEPRQVWELEKYHAESVLWYHGSYHAPTFRRQLQGFYERFSGRMDSPGVNLQWVAMLFSVLTGSISAAPEDKALSWGFRDLERGTLSRQWFRAVIKLLNMAEFTANQSILSAQAIATLTISAHILGFSNMQSVHLAAATKIAKALGLHKLGSDCKPSVEVETGRRVWCQLTTQDWFSIPFTETYLVNPLYSQSLAPVNGHDEELLPLPDDIPTVMSYCRFLWDIAAIMPRLQDDLMMNNTEFTKYEQVCKWDRAIRDLAASKPPFLSNIPLDPSWPIIIPWARRALAISSSHKVIMIHRSFLSESFTNPAFAFTRNTCIDASITIIKEYKMVVQEDGPILWIHQAFAVAASITLVLDLLHRSPSEQDFLKHKLLVEDTLEILRNCKHSMIAVRGEKLLAALLLEVDKWITEGRKRKLDDRSKRPRGLNVPVFVKSFCEDSSLSPQSVQPGPDMLPAQPPLGGVLVDGLYNSQGAAALLFDGDFGPTPSLSYLPNMSEATSFENLLFLANHDFTNP